jgi:hypothetical protein
LVLDAGVGHACGAQARMPALDEARRAPLTLVRGDAVKDVGTLIAGLPDDATAVVTTTWVVAYFSGEQRADFGRALAAASTNRPVAWISAEGHGVVDNIPSDRAPTDDHGVEWSTLGLVTFGAGRVESAELLGYVHPHGSGIDWRAGNYIATRVT